MSWKTSPIWWNVAREAAATHAHRGPAELPRPLLAAEHEADRTVGARGDVESAEGLDHHRLRQHFLDAERCGELRERIMAGKKPTFHRHVGQVGTVRTGFVKVTRRVKSVPRDGREAERRLEVHIAHDAHRVVHRRRAVGPALDGDTQRQCEVRASAEHVGGRLVEGETPGDAHLLHLRELAA